MEFPDCMLLDKRHGPSTLLTPADNQPTATHVTEPILPRPARPQQEPPSNPFTQEPTQNEPSLTQISRVSSDPSEQ